MILKILLTLLVFVQILASVNLGLTVYASYEGLTNLLTWKHAVLTQCEQMRQKGTKITAERRYKSGHVVFDIEPNR